MLHERPSGPLSDNLDEALLPTISILDFPHPQIPNLFQHCFTYAEGWQWSPETELVETGVWFFGEDTPEQNGTQDE